MNTPFPNHTNYSISAYVLEYSDRLKKALSNVSVDELESAANLLIKSAQQGRQVFVCGNGGSAAISDHLCCDHLKGIATDTNLRPRIYSLVGSTATLTAIANDISYTEVFSHQLLSLGLKDDVLIVISSSGNSENIVKVARTAKDLKMHIISMTGFDGGRLREMSNINLHVPEFNYGIVEDTHQSLMHILAQFIRLQSMNIESNFVGNGF